LVSSSVFSCGSFDIIRSSRRWLIIAGQENKAFAAHRQLFLLKERHMDAPLFVVGVNNFQLSFSRINRPIGLCEFSKINFSKMGENTKLRTFSVENFQPKFQRIRLRFSRKFTHDRRLRKYFLIVHKFKPHTIASDRTVCKDLRSSWNRILNIKINLPMNN
jgi:hypothetical protein